MDPRDYIDFGEHYDNNFEHLNPDDMPNNENNLTSNDMEQPMHANMPLESNTQEENIDQTEVKKRKKTSEVWKHFKVCDQKLDDGTILPKVVCIYCKHALTCKTTNGTGHLHRHFNACLKKNGHNHARQSQLSANTGISSFKYSQAKMRVELARFIACAELPFRFAENRCFKRFVQVALQPEFKKVSRNTNRSDVVKLYDEEKKKLINVFSNLKGSIAVTSDMWDGGNNLPFICVTAHYIDENWLLQKRIIAFRLLEFPHTGSSIFHAMMNVFKEYNITHKIFSITFDNASNNSSAIEQFKHVLHPPYGGKFFHKSLPLTISNIQKTFNDTYLLYEKKYSVGTIATQSAPTVHLFGSSSSSSAAIFGMLASKGKQKSVISSRTEVFKYLDTEFVEFMTEEERNNFNILDWWKAHEKNFPVLSIMARDVLTTPVSTVASESAFSAGGRVLDEKRTRLTPQICEALMCLKDWEDADFRTQSFVDEDLSYFEDDSTSSLNEVC
ncbi:hypothetical protein L3X38_005997 [Prunus dulcis]|uniref:BED-type domain-containing protein n=1 Tax=Prunus dulcis TaxID=3755 RepID=A0AAD5F4R5_PRUDU|nr:hypothetical protein L3X38_005997 [Prunus dulcis]